MRSVLVATAALWVVLELRQSIARRPEAVKVSWASEILFRLFVGVGALIAGALSVRAPSATISAAEVADWFGLALFASGIALRLWSFHTLGRYFTLTVQTTRCQPVIDNGPYQLVRHPGYTGLLLVMMALGLLIGNWLSFVCLTIATLGALVFRIRVEERALMRDAGGAYRDYAAAHKRLVPFVW
jgi:protein-S-isoprenylcysteine O-methyltransferase Ste14